MQYPSEIQVGVNKYKIDYEVVFHRRSTVQLKRGRILMKISRMMRVSQRDEVVDKFLKWAEKKLAKVSTNNPILNPVYIDGGLIVTHNRVYELNVFYSRKSSSQTFLLNSNVIKIYLKYSDWSEQDRSQVEKVIQFLVEKVIARHQLDYLKQVIDELNQLHFQEKYNEIKFKRIYGRFGSCSSKRNINIAFRLLFAPREVFRYVCVHELAHLKEFNHSKRFWDLVQLAMPDYKEHEKWLRENGFALG